MARPEVPIVLASSGSLQTQNVSAAEVILRARSSNVQAISCSLTLAAESDPSGAGANAFVLFPGETITLVSIPPRAPPLQVKYITFNDDTDLNDPVLELIEIS